MKDAMKNLNTAVKNFFTVTHQNEEVITKQHIFNNVCLGEFLDYDIDKFNDICIESKDKKLIGEFQFNMRENISDNIIISLRNAAIAIDDLRLENNFMYATIKILKTPWIYYYLDHPTPYLDMFQVLPRIIETKSIKFIVTFDLFHKHGTRQDYLFANFT